MAATGCRRLLATSNRLTVTKFSLTVLPLAAAKLSGMISIRTFLRLHWLIAATTPSHPKRERSQIDFAKAASPWVALSTHRKRQTLIIQDMISARNVRATTAVGANRTRLGRLHGC